MAEAKKLVARLGKLNPAECTMTIHVDARELRARLKIALWLIKLAARIVGMGITVEKTEAK